MAIRTDDVSDPLRAAGRSGGAFRRLASSFTGELISPGDGRYDAHRRVWNGSIDRHPALIARCASVPDVVAALRAARDSGLAVAVRSGGHSFPGLSTCDGGVVIDLGLLKGITVDPDRALVHAQAGVLLGELDRATQAFAAAVPSGAISHTGIAGLTLGGGIGWLMRKHGLTVDRLRAASVITANGERVRASATEEPELFWGLRGGGGNFGIVTDFEFEVCRAGPLVLAGLVLWPLEAGEVVMRSYRDWCAQAPDELTTALVVRRAPSSDLVPRELHGRLVVGVVGCWSGPTEEGERVLRAVREIGAPLLDTFAVRPFVEFQSMLDASYPHGLWAYLRACDVPALTDDILSATIAHGMRIKSQRSTVTVWQLGGAVARAEAGDTAFGGRGSGHIFNITAATDSAEGYAEERDWARDFSTALSAHQRGTYVNFLMDEGEDRVRLAYGAERHARLRDLKRAYDPENVFRLNQNIRPA